VEEDNIFCEVLVWGNKREGGLKKRRKEKGEGRIKRENPLGEVGARRGECSVSPEP